MVLGARSPESASKSTSDQPKSNPKDRMPPMASLSIGMSFIFLVVVNSTICLPTAPSYAEELGGGLVFAGLMMGVGALTCLLMAYPLQKILDKASLKSVWFVMGAGNVTGNVLYACAGLTHSKWTLFIAKIIGGVFSSNSPLLLYISKTVGINHRSRVMMVMSTVLGAGYAIGPFLAFLIGTFCKELRVDNLMLDQNTMPGWLMAVCFFLYMLAQHFLFEEPQRLGEGEGASKEVIPQSEASSKEDQKINVAAVTFLLFGQVATALMLGLFEVFTSIHCSRTWGWSEELAGLYIAAVMTGNLTVSTFCSFSVSGRCSDRSLVLSMSGLCLGGAALLFDFGLGGRFAGVALYTLGSFLLLSSLSVLRASVNALCSKVVPNRMQNRMGTAIMVALTLGRALGPILGAVVSLSGFAALNVLLMAAMLGGSWVTYPHLKAHARAV